MYVEVLYAWRCQASQYATLCTQMKQATLFDLTGQKQRDNKPQKSLPKSPLKKKKSIVQPLSVTK